MARADSAKKKALGIIQSLPPTSTWDDIMYELYVRQKIEAGIAAADAGRVIEHPEVKKRLLKRR